MITKLKKGDNVVVISGKCRTQTGIIKEINRKKCCAVVEGLNIAKKHVKPSQEKPDGGIEEVAKPFHLSKLMYYNKKKKKASKIAIIKHKDSNGIIKIKRLIKATKEQL